MNISTNIYIFFLGWHHCVFESHTAAVNADRAQPCMERYKLTVLARNTTDTVWRWAGGFHCVTLT